MINKLTKSLTVNYFKANHAEISECSTEADDSGVMKCAKALKADNTADAADLVVCLKKSKFILLRF